MSQRSKTWAGSWNAAPPLTGERANSREKGHPFRRDRCPCQQCPFPSLPRGSNECPASPRPLPARIPRRTLIRSRQMFKEKCRLVKGKENRKIQWLKMDQSQAAHDSIHQPNRASQNSFQSVEVCAGADSHVANLPANWSGVDTAARCRWEPWTRPRGTRRAQRQV